MNDKPRKPRSIDEGEVEREILRDRTFSLGEAIGRAGGAGVMKGASPVSRQQQAKVEIEHFLRAQLGTTDCLAAVLLRNVGTSERLLEDAEPPLGVLGQYLEHVLDSEHLLRESVREADVDGAGCTGSSRTSIKREGRRIPMTRIRSNRFARRYCDWWRRCGTLAEASDRLPCN